MYLKSGINVVANYSSFILYMILLDTMWESPMGQIRFLCARPFWGKKVRENVWNTHKSTRFFMLISNIIIVLMQIVVSLIKNYYILIKKARNHVASIVGFDFLSSHCFFSLLDIRFCSFWKALSAGIWNLICMFLWHAKKAETGDGNWQK
jgi:hypothetical protein